MITIGLTGSIGMGKSTTANLFRDAGIPVFDSDATVHALYSRGGGAVDAVEKAFPGTAPDGYVDRTRLSQMLASDPGGFERLETIVHPLVTAERQAFVERAREAGASAVVFDIPLLFETGSEDQVDVLVVVSAPDAIRRARVLQRPGMTEEKLNTIIARQTPDSIKRERADFIIETASGVEDARVQVLKVIEKIQADNGQ